MRKVTKFHLECIDPNTIYDEPKPATAIYLETDMDCTEEQYLDCHYANQDAISSIERQFGILDAEGDEQDDDTWNMGYSSYEIESKNMRLVFDKLCGIFRNLLADGHAVKQSTYTIE